MQEKLSRLQTALEPLHRQYDPLAKLLRVPLQATGYFKGFQGCPVHPTRESLRYATALLEIEDPKLHQRAIQILQQILPLQDQNPSSKTYGTWPKYLEEKLFKIVQPDQNWCDFLSTQLLQISLYHRHCLSASLIAQVDRAILHATKAIQQRKVPYEYTNIAIMGIYVTLIAAQIYEIPELYQYAIERLRGFYDYTVAQNGFSEYNSPTYSIVTLKVLGRLRRDVMDADAKQWVETLYRLIWEEIASHFHVPTGQWAGPHSRSYSTLLAPETIALIERSTSNAIHFGVAEAHPSVEEYRLGLPCPADLESLLLESHQPRTVCKTLCQRIPHQILTTYLAPTFSLGTVNYSDLWSQRRSLLAYWGTPGKPNYLRIRCLHNGTDFATAQFFSGQREGNVLAGVSFANDIDPVNPYLNWGKIRDLKIVSKDLRLRFELGGAFNSRHLVDQLSGFTDIKSPLRFCLNGLYFQILIPYARLGSHSGKWEIHAEESCVYLDLVLWSGKAKTFHLSQLKQAAIAFVLQITTDNTPVSAILLHKVEHALELNWNNLNLKIWTRSANQSFLNSWVATHNSENNPPHPLISRSH